MYVEQEILTAGVDDWVHVAEIAAYAREALYGGSIKIDYPTVVTDSASALASARDEWRAQQERAALRLGIAAVKELIRKDFIQIGETRDGKFVPWMETGGELETRIDEVVSEAVFPLLPGNLFWVTNTERGDEAARNRG